MTTNTLSDLYEVIQSWELPDYHGTGTLYSHRKSGAQLFHLANDDPENLFAFAFSTVPEDSTGVAHILEHTVLCGSRRYPVKDPFLQLLKGSVNTFLNAMTYPDKTVYPAASPVREDLFNMMSVYGDAVFFPVLRREMFQQEGHRLQFDAEGNLQITGIVYNEMIGNYSTHDSVAGEFCYQSLLPDTVYRHDSGGDPKRIPQLTWEQFQDFHRRFYHPSNARILLYGDIPAEEYLAFLDREFLGGFDRGEMFTVEAMQPRWQAPRTFETTYPSEGVEDLTQRTSVTMNWLLFPVTEQRRLLEAAVLTEVLLGHSGSPLAMALIDSGLGQDLSPVLGIETDLREAVFSVGLRGTEPHHREAIEALVLETMERLAREGIEADLIEGALRIVEFRNRELKSGPQGMRVMSRALRGWMYGGSPALGLRFSEDVADLRLRLEADPQLLQKLITTLLLENPHRSTVTVRPDPAQSAREQSELREVLDRRLEKFSPAERDAVETAENALQELQEAPDDPEVLARIPFLKPEDLPRDVRRIPGDHDTLGDGTPLYLHRLGTNGILYLDLAFDLPNLSSEQELLLNLLGAAFTEVGLPGLPYDRFQQELRLKTGGISAFISNSSSYQDRGTVRRLFMVRLKVLDRVHPEGIALLRRLLQDIDFGDHHRLQQILEELNQDMLSALIPSGHYFAGLRAARGLSGLSALEEEMNGITQLSALRRYLQENVATLAAQLSQLTSVIMDPQRLSVNLTGEKQTLQEVQRLLPELVDAVRQRSQLSHRSGVGPDGAEAGRSEAGGAEAGGILRVYPAATAPEQEYLLASAGVSYVACSLEGIPFGDDLAAAQDLLAHVMRTGVLWEKIRMRGGAYGAFASSRTLEGLFSFASYRDPRTTATVQAFREALQEMSATALAQTTIDNGRVSLLGKELRPLTTREEGFISFRRQLLGVTDELRQHARDQLRGVTPQAVQAAAAVLLERLPRGRVAILGGQGGLEEYRRAAPAVEVVSLDV